MASRRPSECVGFQVKALRRKRDWRQEDLARRLERFGFNGWRQTKIAKVESGQGTRLALDDVFELAVALDVAPVYLFTPTEQRDESGKQIEVQLGAEAQPLGAVHA
jgi:transcriptional regulator with XRE-family HTH domain